MLPVRGSGGEERPGEEGEVYGTAGYVISDGGNNEVLSVLQSLDRKGRIKMKSRRVAHQLEEDRRSGEAR